jgi:hypothetical protein
MYELKDEEYEILAPVQEFLYDRIPFTRDLYGFKLASSLDENICEQEGLSLRIWIFLDENTTIDTG